VITSLRQRHPAWGTIPLGNNPAGNGYTIASHGCLITCIAGLCDTTPDIINRNGIERGLFAPGNGNALTLDANRWCSTPWRLIYTSQRFPVDPFPTGELNKLRAWLDVGAQCIAETQWPHTRGQHFVRVINDVERTDGVTLLIADPERDGQVEEIHRFYARWPIALVRIAVYMRDANTSREIVDANPYQIQEDMAR
jgi:hypothetical protein